jgi:hypothetical protein
MAKATKPPVIKYEFVEDDKSLNAVFDYIFNTISNGKKLLHTK